MPPDSRQLLRQDACPFCRIADSDPDGQIMRRIGSAFVIEPLNPVTPGHLLVIPYEHVQDAAEEPLATAATMHAAALVARDIGSCNVITSVGKPATQSVLHLHVHVVPRCAGDGLRLPWTPNEKAATHPWELQ